MKILDLKNALSNVFIEGEIVYVEQPREVTVNKQNMYVCTAIVRDETGEIKLSLWNDQTKIAVQGKKIKVEGGYITTYKGEPQINIPKNGKFEVIG